jgi:uncharacterized coiled-coil DUF342 family protein
MRMLQQQGDVMYEASNLRDVQALCNEIMNSPYFRKQTPAELKQLREMLNKVSLLVHESVPPLIAEIKHLRNQNKKLTAEIEATGLSQQSWQGNLTA